MSMPEFCEDHGNLKQSCSICKPRESVIVLLEGIVCPVFLNENIPKHICDNSGCVLTNATSRTETYECTSCGWEFSSRKTRLPCWVECNCGVNEVREAKHVLEPPQKCLRCSSSRYKCATCRQVGARCVCPGHAKNN